MDGGLHRGGGCLLRYQRTQGVQDVLLAAQPLGVGLAGIKAGHIHPLVDDGQLGRVQPPVQLLGPFHRFFVALGAGLLRRGVDEIRAELRVPFGEAALHVGQLCRA